MLYENSTTVQNRTGAAKALSLPECRLFYVNHMTVHTCYTTVLSTSSTWNLNHRHTNALPYDNDDDGDYIILIPLTTDGKPEYLLALGRDHSSATPSRSYKGVGDSFIATVNSRMFLYWLDSFSSFDALKI